MQVKHVEYYLEQPLQYHSNGEVALTSKVVLYPPSMAQLSKVAKLKQAFFNAIKSTQGSQKTEVNQAQDSDAEITPEVAIMVLYMSDVDIEGCFNIFKDLLITGACKIDNLVNMGAHHYGELSVKDIEQLLGLYIANFIIPSSMKPTKGS